jgi:nucleotide-binding universal stress UspA family protein
MKLNRISVGVDFSAGSLAAIRVARRIGARGTLIRLVHVIDSAVFFRGPNYGDPMVIERLLADMIKGAKAELEVFAEELRVGGFQVELDVRVGRPAEDIQEAAIGTSMLVGGTHGRGFLGRVLIGSTAEELARRSVVPVLVVRESADKPIERILVAVDPTGPCHDAIVAAGALSDRLGVPLEAIHAANLPPVLPYSSPGALEEMQKILEAHLESAPKLVKGTFEKILGRPVKVHVVTGSPAHEIAKHARPSDLIVCGTHGRSALGRLVFGSVATKLLREAPGPILVVRPAEDESSRDELDTARTGATPVAGVRLAGPPRPISKS